MVSVSEMCFYCNLHVWKRGWLGYSGLLAEKEKWRVTVHNRQVTATMGQKHGRKLESCLESFTAQSETSPDVGPLPSTGAQE